MKNLPDDGTQLHNYVVNVLKVKKYVDDPRKVTEIVSARIVYRDLRTGIEDKILPSQFKNKIPNTINSTIKLHPEVFGTTKEEIIESAYQSMLNKF